MNAENSSEINTNKSPDSGVVFNDSQGDVHMYANKVPGMIRFVMKSSGMSEKQSQLFLWVFIIMLFGISFFLVYSSSKSAEIPPEALENPEYGLSYDTEIL